MKKDTYIITFLLSSLIFYILLSAGCELYPKIDLSPYPSPLPPDTIPPPITATPTSTLTPTPTMTVTPTTPLLPSPTQPGNSPTPTATPTITPTPTITVTSNNLALNKEIESVTSTTDNNLAQYAIDGDPETFWQSGTSNAYDFILIDLLATYTIDKIIIHFDDVFFPVAYNIGRIEKGLTILEPKLSGVTSGGIKEHYIGVTTRYIGIQCTERRDVGSPLPFAIKEIEIYPPEE